MKRFFLKNPRIVQIAIYGVLLSSNREPTPNGYATKKKSPFFAPCQIGPHHQTSPTRPLNFFPPPL